MAANVVRLPDRGRMPAVEETSAERIATWLRQVQQKDGRSWEQIGRAAETAPTNITRFLKNGYPVPRLATLAKIAKAVGVLPPDLTLTLQPHGFVDIPVLLPIVASRKGIAAARMTATETIRVQSRYKECVAVKITADTGSLAGVLLGDTVVCDPEAAIELNSLVVVALGDGTAGVYRVQGPYLIPQAPGNLPSLVTENECILGVARQVQRELR